MTFADRLKAERKRLGISQPEAARLLDMSPRWVQVCEAGTNVPSQITQEGALERLNITPAEAAKRLSELQPTR